MVNPSEPIPSDPLLVIVEDSDEDFELTQWALCRAKFGGPILRLDRVVHALDFLRTGEPAPSTDRERPCLMLLDINLPDGSGQEVLESARADETFAPIPIVVHTTTKSMKDLASFYRLGAAGCILKPLDRDAYAQQVEAFVDYWVRAVTLPSP